jgi:hypothetical protein
MMAGTATTMVQACVPATTVAGQARFRGPVLA